MKFKFLFFALIFAIQVNAQEFKYAFVTDTHVGGSTGEEDLKRTVRDINNLKDIDFVLLTGDITEMGTYDEIKLAKSILKGLKKPFYIIPGNHDTGWSESGGVDFIKAFGYDKFYFDHKGYRFIGCASGPYVRMSDGHIPRDAVMWLEDVLNKTPKDMPLIFVNHYPTDNSLDNWYDALDRLKNYNVQYAICGHGHANRALDFEGIPATMGRSNLRAKAEIGGYNIVTVSNGKVEFSEKTPGVDGAKLWRTINTNTKPDTEGLLINRPSYHINTLYSKVKPLWKYHSSANVILTPATNNEVVVIGNSLGTIEVLDFTTGKLIWDFKTQGAIYSSPVIYKDRVILGSGDGNIYALNVKNGQKIWQIKAKKAVLGSPIMVENIAYIGASDGKFRAIDVNTGKVKWTFSGVPGAIVGKPLAYNGMIIFGSWGRKLHALNINSGRMIWEWDNGHANRMFSPAMVTPVAKDGIIYIAAPDRVLTAIDASNGATLWRNATTTVRESIGISNDGSEIYGKTMNNEIVAFKTGKVDEGVSWRLNMNYGYEHVPSMIVANGDEYVFGTKNGIVFSFDPVKRNTNWAYKIDNSMVNTVNTLGNHLVLVATMDGVVTLLNSNSK